MGDAIDSESATVAEAFLTTADMRADTPAILTADQQVALSWSEYGTAARRAASGLAAHGLKHGDAMGLLLSNRPEFHIADAAALLIGATPFSMYNTSAPEQLAHVIRDAGCRIIITEPAFLDRLRAGIELSGATIDRVIVVGTADWSNLFANSEIRHHPRAAPDDLATLIYTSGTTGPPKGVELTHRNILTMTREVAAIVGAQPAHRAISALPMAHIAERASTHYLPMAVGLSVVCCPNYSDVIPLLPKVQPDIFFSPPRLWEKLRSSLAAAVTDGAGHERIRNRMGFGRLSTALTGAAPCPPAVIDFFTSIGIPLRELYGLSETTGVVSITTGTKVRPGSVGPPLPSAEVRVADDGELLVRGPLVMAGYRNQPEATAAAIDADGWLHTGDIASVSADGELRIVDRKKELIINAAGKNMSPSNIEARLKESSPVIGQVCVIGDGRPYNVALIVLDAAAAMSNADGVQAHVRDAVERANAKLARVEQIKRFAVLADEWVPDSDELTPTMKLKRRPIAEKYATQIDALYNGGNR
jgi:long-subunit acyl-CoA synthetase (AMP-forming)